MKHRWLAVGFLGIACMAATAQTAATPMAPMAKEEHEHEHKPTVPSTNLVVTVDGKPVTLTLEDLQKMPQKIVSVHNAHTKADETYSGVPLPDLLAKYGVTTDGEGAHRIYHSYLRAEGTDHYWVLYSASEFETTVHNAEVIVALTLDGKPLAEDGQFKLVAGAEKKPARWVRNLAALTFVTVE
ncbi:molybdopterin-dependent oxidoreductase [Granulicella sp. WH15]|uniref:molybdopterin-dependent oxidoreductase n=1 Tax=Granulicella sp. WH15 TaxID=2602070 RepID=UPI0013677530|nr:molybdopterin-dependent oxidoreductase [Granulicella sp. WH15]QHN03704.1 molybdopterin-dependent oxidoreductase [Granulicella sp. WH15]